MDAKQAIIPSIEKAYAFIAQSLKNNPIIFLPFVIFALFELVMLIFFYFIPYMPLRLVFGPPIRTLWGEPFLHYPAFFLLLPKLCSIGRMILAIVLSSLLTVVAVILISHVYNKQNIKLNLAFKSAIKNYISVLIIFFIFITSFYLSTKLVTIGLARYFVAGHTKLLFLKADVWMGPILACVNFVLALFIQSAFMYAVPLIVIGQQKLLKSIFGSFNLYKRLFCPTLILVGLPMLSYIPIIILNHNAAYLINKLFPEFIVVVSILGIIISSLLIDPLITASTTFLYLRNKEN